MSCQRNLRTRGYHRERKKAGDIRELRMTYWEERSERAGMNAGAREGEVCAYGVRGEPDWVCDKIQGVATETSG